MSILTTKEQYIARCVAADDRQRQIAIAQASAQRWASASVLGRIGNQRNWNWAVNINRKTGRAQQSFPVYVYGSLLHQRGYAESKDNVPHRAKLKYKLNIRPKAGQALIVMQPLT